MEVFLGLVVVEVAVLFRIQVEIDLLKVVGNDGVNHFVFFEIEIVTVSSDVVLQEIKHAFLRDRGEE